MHGLERHERLQLMKFICSFAWADLEVSAEERRYVGRLVRRLEMDSAEAAQIERWLEVPPHPEEVDPTLVPEQHRRLFVDSILGLIEADGDVSEEERSSLALFERLLP
jgi:uncharacterized tellurite resistance protein B-like protein